MKESLLSGQFPVASFPSPNKKCRPRRVGTLKSCCRSLRWHYPDQVQRVGDDLGRPLSWTRPSSPRRLTNFTQSKYRIGSLGSQPSAHRHNPSATLRTGCKGSPSTRDFGELSRTAPAEGLRGDPERLFRPRPEGRGLAPSKYQSVDGTFHVCPEIYVDKSVLKYQYLKH